MLPSDLDICGRFGAETDVCEDASTALVLLVVFAVRGSSLAVDMASGSKERFRLAMFRSITRMCSTEQICTMRIECSYDGMDQERCLQLLGMF